MKLNKIIQFAILGNILIPLVLIANVLSQEVVDQADTLIKEQMYLNKQKENFNNRKQQESKVFESNVDAYNSSGELLTKNTKMTVEGSSIYMVRNGMCSAFPKSVIVIRDAKTGEQLSSESPYQCR